jgi:hypothetical protein
MENTMERCASICDELAAKQIEEAVRATRMGLASDSVVRCMARATGMQICAEQIRKSIRDAN